MTSGLLGEGRGWRRKVGVLHRALSPSKAAIQEGTPQTDKQES